MSNAVFYRFMEIVDVSLCGTALGKGMLGGDLNEGGSLMTDQCDNDRWITWAGLNSKKQELTIRSRAITNWASTIHAGATGALSFVLKTGDGNRGNDWNYSWTSCTVSEVRLTGAEQDSLAQVEFNVFVHSPVNVYPMAAVTGSAGIIDL